MTIEERDTARAIQSMNRKMKDETKIDWEQRRYEIAKECQAAIIQGLYNCASLEKDWAKLSAQRAVKCADALIEELKNNPIK